MIVGVIGSGSIGPDLAYGFLSALAAGEGGKVYLLDIAKEEKTHVGEFQALLLIEDREQVAELEEGKKEIEELTEK